MKSIKTGWPLSEARETSWPCWSTSVIAGRQSLVLAAAYEPGSTTLEGWGEQPPSASMVANPAAIVSSAIVDLTLRLERNGKVAIRQCSNLNGDASTGRARLGAHRVADKITHLHHTQAVERGDRGCAAGTHGIGEGGDLVGQRVALAEIDLLSGNFRINPAGRRRRFAVELDAARLVIDREIGVGLKDPDFTLAA